MADKKSKVNLIDCTIRDGGLMNKWQFSYDLVKAVYDANIKAGVEIMEIGYKASKEMFDPAEYGPWRFCDEKDLQKIVGHTKTDMKLSMMVDIGRCTKDDIPPKSESLIDVIRVACYDHQIEDAIEIANSCVEKGYLTFLNIMAVSRSNQESIDACLVRIEKETSVEGVYLVDSFGSFAMNEIARLTNHYVKMCPSKAIGYHGHNNQQLALANTLISEECGATYLDGSYFGMGRGAGNCPLELLMANISREDYDITPVIQVLEEEIRPLMKDLQWGYHVPYALTGIFNEHPRDAMAYMAGENEHGIHGLYNALKERNGNDK